MCPWLTTQLQWRQAIKPFFLQSVVGREQVDPGFKSIFAVLSDGIVSVISLQEKDPVSAVENTRSPLWYLSPQVFNRNSSLRLSPSLSSGPDSGNSQPQAEKKWWCLDRTDDSQGNSKHGSHKLHLKMILVGMRHSDNFKFLISYLVSCLQLHWKYFSFPNSLLRDSHEFISSSLRDKL